MTLQYISDTTGKHTAVIIPIEEWERITEKHEDLKALEIPPRRPSDFRGAISPLTADKMVDYLQQARSEWGSTTS